MITHTLKRCKNGMMNMEINIISVKHRQRQARVTPKRADIQVKLVKQD